jgi:hypothetical protein
VALPCSVVAQATGPQTAPAAPPATKLEGFKPAAGSVVTFGYDELGRIGLVSADVRELRSTTGGAPVRGLVVEVVESQYRTERSFVDADEIAELIRGIDAILEVKANPTKFKNFEVRYTTRGELRLVAFNSGNDIKYSVEAGRTLRASRQVTGDDIRKLREMFVAAQAKLASAP